MKNTADIVVIGGGPAGMATALEASKKGASVPLWETGTLLGGNAAGQLAISLSRDLKCNTEKV
ncbi:MAG: hypothetical protein Ct9H90mP5_02950 [Acidimicrobiaceae bacterium]|nr:MAG: hypothetical protein Ct9H90mP5_02950 [Acidimicrobiaceae bacterium]